MFPMLNGFRFLAVLVPLVLCVGCELLYEEPEEEETEPEEIFFIVDEMPQTIPNDLEGMRRLQQCIVYPEAAKEAGIEGRVFVAFTVNTKGRVVDPVVQRGIGAGCDEEAVRCVRKMQFRPARHEGDLVAVKLSLPVTFRLR
ncbi:MAG: energy transducer TonB [Rhodothermales bacterium]